MKTGQCHEPAALLAVLLIGLLLPPLSPAMAAPPLAAYGQLPALDNITLSPDGRRYAVIIGDGDAAQIQVRAVADGALLSLSPVEKSKARNLFWAGSDHLLAMVSTTQAPPKGMTGRTREWYQLQDLDLAAKSSRLLLDHVKNTMNVVIGDPISIGDAKVPTVILPGLPFIFGSGDMHSVSGLYRVDLQSAKTQLAEKGKDDTIDWLVDAAGVAIARVDYDEYKAEWTLFIRKGDDWQKAYVEHADIDLPQVLALDEDGGSVLVRSHASGTWAVHAVPLVAPILGPALPDIDPDLLLIDRRTRRVMGTKTVDIDTIRYQFRNPADQRAWDGIAKAFPGELVTFESWSDDRMVVIVEVQGPANGDGYFIVDRRRHEARPLGSRYPGVLPSDLGAHRVIHYKAGDGLDIPAYLTLPPGRAATALPLLVFPHGGPVARDNPGFDWWAQAMASRGYAVLQPQFRGSDGLGDALREAGYGQWGRRMQTDLSDGVRSLAVEGLIDPARVCIVGASYGGYAALAGVALDPGVYRCASAVAGVSDLRRFLGGTGGSRISPKRSIGQRFWLRLTGAVNNGDPLLDRLSPALHADQITVPVQLIHGKDDTVVPIEQSQQMEKALKAAGKPVEFVTLDGEDHWLSRAATRTRMLAAVMEFVERNNPPSLVARSTPFAPSQTAPPTAAPQKPPPAAQ